MVTDAFPLGRKDQCVYVCVYFEVQIFEGETLTFFCLVPELISGQSIVKV